MNKTNANERTQRTKAARRKRTTLPGPCLACRSLPQPSVDDFCTDAMLHHDPESQINNHPSRKRKQKKQAPHNTGPTDVNHSWFQHTTRRTHYQISKSRGSSPAWHTSRRRKHRQLRACPINVSRQHLLRGVGKQVVLETQHLLHLPAPKCIGWCGGLPQELLSAIEANNPVCDTAKGGYEAFRRSRGEARGRGGDTVLQRQAFS